MKKLYEIIKATTTVARRGGIKERDTFSFLIEKDFEDFEDKCFHGLTNAINTYNYFCPEDFYIISYDIDTEIEKVGEIWL